MRLGCANFSSASSSFLKSSDYVAESQHCASLMKIWTICECECVWVFGRQIVLFSSRTNYQLPTVYKQALQTEFGFYIFFLMKKFSFAIWSHLSISKMWKGWIKWRCLCRPPKSPPPPFCWQSMFCLGTSFPRSETPYPICLWLLRSNVNTLKIYVLNTFFYYYLFVFFFIHKIIILSVLCYCLCYNLFSMLFPFYFKYLLVPQLLIPLSFPLFFLLSSFFLYVL